MNWTDNEKVVDVDQALQSTEEQKVDSKGGEHGTNREEEEADLVLQNEGTFFTEGILNVNEGEEEAEARADEPDKDSNFQTAVFEDIKQRPTFISSAVQHFTRPSVNFKLERTDKKDKSQSAPPKKLQAKRSSSSSNNRQFAETPDKSVIHPYFESSPEQFLPSIQCERGKFPNRRNLHHKRIFVRYITNKMEKEHELLSMLRSSANMPLNSSTMKAVKVPLYTKTKPPRTSSVVAANSRPNKDSSLYATCKDSDSQNYYDTRTVFAAPPPPPPSAKMRKQPGAASTSFQRSKSTLAPSALPTAQSQRQRPIRSAFEMDDETATKSVHWGREHSNINLVNNIVDLNVISSTSKLSGHYLSYAEQGKSRLADLNLNELWPASTMYKVSIKENPWVTSFKAKSQANEINSSFRDNFDSSLSFTRLHSSSVTAAKVKASQHALTASQTNFFPNIKHLL